MNYLELYQNRRLADIFEDNIDWEQIKSMYETELLTAVANLVTPRGTPMHLVAAFNGQKAELVIKILDASNSKVIENKDVSIFDSIDWSESTANYFKKHQLDFKMGPKSRAFLFGRKGFEATTEQYPHLPIEEKIYIYNNLRHKKYKKLRDSMISESFLKDLVKHRINQKHFFKKRELQEDTKLESYCSELERTIIGIYKGDAIDVKLKEMNINLDNFSSDINVDNLLLNEKISILNKISIVAPNNWRNAIEGFCYLYKPFITFECTQLDIEEMQPIVDKLPNILIQSNYSDGHLIEENFDKLSVIEKDLYKSMPVLYQKMSRYDGTVEYLGDVSYKLTISDFSVGILKHELTHIGQQNLDADYFKNSKDWQELKNNLIEAPVDIEDMTHFLQRLVKPEFFHLCRINIEHYLKTQQYHFADILKKSDSLYYNQNAKSAFKAFHAQEKKSLNFQTEYWKNLDKELGKRRYYYAKDIEIHARMSEGDWSVIDESTTFGISRKIKLDRIKELLEIVNRDVYGVSEDKVNKCEKKKPF